MIQFYGYPKCSTCQNAKKSLQKRGVNIKELDITMSPPSAELLRAVLKNGQYTLSDLFNKSGQLYREWNMKEKMKTMNDSELLALLSQHGKLIKRPFVTDGKNFTVGFDEKLFDSTWI